MAEESATELLRRETRLRPGIVPRRLGGHAIPDDADILEGDEYVMRTPFGVAFHYRKGEGVVVERAPGADPATERLFLNGSVYAAVAAINGLMPIHASAIACDGKVYAFTGPSGAGKSTLSAALGMSGLPLFCDDTLVLDIRDPAVIFCVPGHKRLKLWPDALELAGASPQEKVAADLDKVFAEPAAGTFDEALPLANLVFLEEGTPARIEPIRGAERLMRFQDDHYTQAMWIAASGADRSARFAQLAHLALSIDIFRFVRPRDRAQFAVGVAMVEAHVRNFGKGRQ